MHKNTVLLYNQMGQKPDVERFIDFQDVSHGVSGGGGSNPLVSTKNSFKNQLLRLVFLCLSFARGNFGELLGRNHAQIRIRLAG